MEQNFIKYPIGIQSFESLRREGYSYIDKTDLIWQLANQGSYYFLSRPRRFGKSLLLSTLEAYFEGKHDMFEGLAFAKLEKEWVENGSPEASMARLTAMMADTDYRIVGDSELYFQNFLYIFFRLLGLYTEVERATSDGRTNMIVQAAKSIYIFEFKLNQTADIALRQIEEKGYAKPFATDSRKLYKIGVNFSTEARRIDDWLIK